MEYRGIKPPILSVALRGAGINTDSKTSELILRIIERIEEKKGAATIDEIISIRQEWEARHDTEIENK